MARSSLVSATKVDSCRGFEPAMADGEDSDSHREEVDCWEGVSMVILIPVLSDQSSSQKEGIVVDFTSTASADT